MASGGASTSSGSEGGYTTVGGYPSMHVQAVEVEVESRLPEGKTSAFWAIFLVVNAALGAGLLVFPLSFYMTGGIVTGILIELVSQYLEVDSGRVSHVIM